jgi:transposase
MANTPISMSKIRQLLRLDVQGYSKLRIAEQTSISRNTLKKYLTAFKESQLSYEEINLLSDKALEELFVKPRAKPLSAKLETLFGLFPSMDKDLKKKGVNQLLLWEDYKKKHPDGVGRSQFNHYYAQWKAQVNPVMHLEHKAGDKTFIDFAGDKLSIVDRETGEVRKVEVFVSILGASQLTYVEAVNTQRNEDLIGASENGFHYFGGVTAAIVPDNLKSAVTKSNKYEAELNELFADFAHHYGTTVLPARAYRPRDKALVENAVRLVYTRIYTRVCRQTYYSLEELNAAIREALEEHNNRLLKGRNYSRRQQFEEIERATLQPLPVLRYELRKQLFVTVMKNGHVSLNVDKHYYSVPYRFIGKKVKLMYSRNTVEIFYNYQRIAMHERIKSPYNYTTDKDHLASTHRFVTEWTPERFLSWGESIHEDVKLYILKILQRKQHPEQGYKSCLGVLTFAKKAGNDRLIKACQRALDYGIYNYKTIKNILEKGLDKDNDPGSSDALQMPEHENIRGENYYQ